MGDDREEIRRIHNVVGDETLLTMFWANERFDRSDPDTVPELVAPGGGVQ